MPRRPNPRRRSGPRHGHVCALHPEMFSRRSPDSGGPARIYVVLLLFHVVLIAAVVLFNCLDSRPAPRHTVSADGGGGIITTCLIALGVLVLATQAWLRRARRRLDEQHLRRLRLRAMPPPPDHPLVSG